jgi:ABC-type multidrug transport system ATPase subunit
LGSPKPLLGDPKLIIVDEPAAGLDPEERGRFLNLLGEISDRVIVILSTHIVDDVEDLCRRMAVIYLGKVIASGETVPLVKSLEGCSGHPSNLGGKRGLSGHP